MYAPATISFLLQNITFNKRVFDYEYEPDICLLALFGLCYPLRADWLREWSSVFILIQLSPTSNHIKLICIMSYHIKLQFMLEIYNIERFRIEREKCRLQAICLQRQLVIDLQENSSRGVQNTIPKSQKRLINSLTIDFHLHFLGN